MMAKLAIDGGVPVRTEPMPRRGLIGEAEKAAAMRVLDQSIDSGDALGYNGPFEKQYEQDFVDFMGGGFADGVNSGTNALFVALGGLQLDPFSEVIVPPITDPGGIMPVVMVACVPVVADSDPRSFNTSAEQIEPMITDRTRAIIVAHISGEPADMDPIMELARSRGLYVIEDCAQAHGARYKGRLVGTMGDVAAFSTMGGKHHCSGGQGGIVYTADEPLYWRARRFADRGKSFNLDVKGNVVAGLNCNLNELSAAIGSVQVRRLPSIIERRRNVGEAIKKGLTARKAVSLGWQVPQTEPSYWFLRAKLDVEALRVDKETFCQAVVAEGIHVTASYRFLSCEMPWFKNKAVFGSGNFPWDCSDYKGPREGQFKIDNAITAVESHFCVGLHEKYGDKEVADTLAALEKVEKAYLR